MSSTLLVLVFLITQTRWSTPAIEEHRNTEFESRTLGLCGQCLTLSIMEKKTVLKLVSYGW